MKKISGFTLIEILIAVAIFSIILAALYSTFFLSHKAVAGFDESMLKLQECRGALDMLRREIESSFYKDGDKNTGLKLEDRDVHGKQTSRIAFTTFSPLKNSISEIKYYVKESDDKLILYKEISSPLDPKKEIQEAEIIEDIEEFIIEANYSNTWVKTLDTSQTHKLPSEVKISLKVKIKDKDILLFIKAKPMIT